MGKICVLDRQENTIEPRKVRLVVYLTRYGSDEGKSFPLRRHISWTFNSFVISTGVRDKRNIKGFEIFSYNEFRSHSVCKKTKLSVVGK